MLKSTFSILILIGLLVIGGVGTSFSQALDISSGGTPTITGALGGSVTGSSSVLNDLVVTINFGEVSPANPNSIIKVTVPVAIRSNQDYKVQATITGSANSDPRALQRSDIGFGVANFRRLGGESRICNNSPHILYAPFNNDPSLNLTTDSNGRISFASDLADISGATTLVSGPTLSKGDNKRKMTDGYVFDAVFTIVPQYFAPGTTTATITLTISAGFNVPC